MKSPKPGEVFSVNLGFSGKTRPMIIVSREDNDAPRTLVLAVPITSKYRGRDYEVVLEKEKFINEKSYVNIQDLQSVGYQDLIKRIGLLHPKKLKEIQTVLSYALNLSP